MRAAAAKHCPLPSPIILSQILNNSNKDRRCFAILQAALQRAKCFEIQKCLPNFSRHFVMPYAELIQLSIPPSMPPPAHSRNDVRKPTPPLAEFVRKDSAARMTK